jgi:hypothetical protein
MQYQEGTVAVTNGSAIVTCVDPDPADPAIDPPSLWQSEVQAGDLFVVLGDSVIYTIDTVNSDTQLTLTTSYQGATVSPAGIPEAGAVYGIHRDFSTNYSMPLLTRGDIETAALIRLAIQTIDTGLNDLDGRVTTLEP